MDTDRICLRILWILLLITSLCSFNLAAQSIGNESSTPHIAHLKINGAIGPATTDYLLRGMEQARKQGATLVLLEIDTPGGLSDAMRDIIQAILASPLPVVSYVHPAGARAASAGTYILYASHIAAMAPATTLGAATPVQIGGPGLPGGEQEPDENTAPEAQEDAAPQPKTAMERKIVNDAVAFIQGLAQRHGRNAEWAERAVREGVSLTASDALEEDVIDLIASTIPELMRQIDGRQVRMENGSQKLATNELPVRLYEADWRNKLLAMITNPQIAYILLLIGIYGLIFEGYNPGAMLPGIVGAIALLLALYALQLLPVNYVGLALIIFGVALMVAEAFAPSFGVLGIGGVVALVFGSVMLIDPEVPGLGVSRELIGAIALVSSSLVLALMLMVARSLRMDRSSSGQVMVGRMASVNEANGHNGRVRIDDEWWSIESDTELRAGQQVKILSRSGLKLKVEPLKTEENQSD